MEFSYAFIEVARLQRLHGDKLVLQFDVIDRSLVERDPRRASLVSPPQPESVEAAPLGRLISTLILQEDGWIVSLQHGFSADYAIGLLGQDNFREAASRWNRDVLPDFPALARETWASTGEAPQHLPFTNWYSAVSGASHARG